MKNKRTLNLKKQGGLTNEQRIEIIKEFYLTGGRYWTTDNPFLHINVSAEKNKRKRKPSSPVGYLLCGLI